VRFAYRKPAGKGRSKKSGTAPDFFRGSAAPFATKNPGAESQETCASRFLLALFARRSVAIRPIISRGAFLLRKNSGAGNFAATYQQIRRASKINARETN